MFARIMSRKTSFVLCWALVLGIFGTAYAQLGTTHSPYGVPKKPLAVAPQQGVNPFHTYQNAEYATGGVALRNQNERSIIISGLPVGSTTVDAYIYWVFLLDTTTPPPAVSSIKLIRTFPVGPTAVPTILNGTLVATGSDPCWGSVGAYMYRAQVPASIASGNGNYLVRLLPGASGLTTGEDPWDGNVVFELAEGASLVIISTGSHTVSLYDNGIAGLTSIGTPVSYTLNLPQPASGNQVLWDNWGSDGQIGASRTPLYADDTTIINDYPVAGPGIGALDSDSDWNGSAGFPLPQLWDDTGHDITSAAPAGTTELNVDFNAPSGDCWNVVGNIVSQ
jgi:hypothetical protein